MILPKVLSNNKFNSFLLPQEAMLTFGLVLFIAIFYAMMGALVLTPLMMRFWGGRRLAEEPKEAE